MKVSGIKQKRTLERKVRPHERELEAVLSKLYSRVKMPDNLKLGLESMKSQSKEAIIEEMEKSGATYVKTSVSNEACAVSIAIKDIQAIDQLPDNFNWSECSTGLDEEDY